MALGFCSTSGVSFQNTLPASNGGCTWKNGNLPALCQWNKRNPGHDIQVMVLFENFISSFSNLCTWLYPACSRWLQKDEEIMMDIVTCAMAFRLLRMNGYDVSSGSSQFTNLEFPTALLIIFDFDLTNALIYIWSRRAVSRCWSFCFLWFTSRIFEWY